MEQCQAIDASAGGLFFQAEGYGGLVGATLRAATGANATATLREGGATGRVIGVLAAVGDTTDHLTPGAPVRYYQAVHVTITGGGAELILFGA